MNSFRLVSILLTACVALVLWDHRDIAGASGPTAVSLTGSARQDSTSADWARWVVRARAADALEHLRGVASTEGRSNPFGSDAPAAVASVASEPAVAAPSGWRCLGGIQGMAATVQGPKGERMVLRPGGQLEGFTVREVGVRSVVLIRGRTTWTIGG